MDLRERLAKVAERIQMSFAISTKSLDHFMDVIGKQGCTEVMARCSADVSSYPPSDIFLLQFFDTFGQDSLCLISKTRGGRDVVLIEDYAGILGSPRFMREDPQVRLLKLLLTANSRLGEIGRRFPTMEIHIEGPGGTRMSSDLWNNILQMAYNLAPYPKPIQKTSNVFQ